MALIQWDSSLSVGVRAMDDQHKGLVQTLNELHDAMTQGLARQAIGPLLEKLVKYTREHFLTEEALLKRTQYPDFGPHHDKHVDLTRQVDEYLARFRTGDICLSINLLDFLRNWLTNHIQKEDRQYGPWLNQHGMA